jgi:hyaluronoglucosaminidase
VPGRAAPNLKRVRRRRLRAALAAVALAATLAATLAGGTPVTSAATSAVPYRFRGVIFGPYGRPWSHVERMSMLAWMGRPWRDTGRPRMNLYIQAAKDDIYQRVRWRVPYPADQMRDFRTEIALGRSLGVQWVPNVSPGLPMIPSPVVPDGAPSRDICFSCPKDLDVLVAKLRPFAHAGVRTFMVSFDDVLKVSTHVEDLLAYGIGDAAYGRMNAELLNRVRDRLRAAFPPGPGEEPVTILTVPATYSGTKHSAYLTAFGAALAADIPVMWTGTHIVSQRILGSEAAAFSAAISTPASGKRRLIVWDNFPANDYNGNIFSGTGLPTNFKLNMGPYKGRGADLAAAVDGIVANPMNEEEASKIPLYTVAAYLNDPGAYTAAPASCPLDHLVAGCLAEADWLEGVAEFGGPAAAAVFDFVAQMRSTPLDRTESPVFRARWQAWRDALGAGFWPEARAALDQELRAEASAPARLASGLGNPGFMAETAHHLRTLARNVRAGMLASEVLAAIRPGLRAEVASSGPSTATVTGVVTPPDLGVVAVALARLAPAEVLMRASPYSVHGDRFEHSIDRVYVRQNQMDAFVDFVHTAVLSWLPAASFATTRGVSVTVNGHPAVVDAGGRFAVTVPLAPGQQEIIVVATDGAGLRTGVRLALV